MPKIENKKDLYKPVNELCDITQKLNEGTLSILDDGVRTKIRRIGTNQKCFEQYTKHSYKLFSMVHNSGILDTIINITKQISKIEQGTIGKILEYITGEKVDTLTRIHNFMHLYNTINVRKQLSEVIKIDKTKSDMLFKQMEDMLANDPIVSYFYEFVINLSKTIENTKTNIIKVYCFLVNVLAFDIIECFCKKESIIMIISYALYEKLNKYKMRKSAALLEGALICSNEKCVGKIEGFDFKSNNNDVILGSHFACKKTLSELDNNVVNINKKYDIIKKLGGGKSGAFVFLVSDKKTKEKYILKLYVLGILGKIGDRDVREIFTCCNFSGTDGFPKLHDAGVTYCEVNDYWNDFLDEYFNCANADGKKNIKIGSFYNPAYYMVTELVSGSELIKINPFAFNIKKRLIILMKIAQAMMNARKKSPGFIHNDLHPGNIFINDSTENMPDKINENNFNNAYPKITIIDFDISISIDYAQQLIESRQLFGKLLVQEAIVSFLTNIFGNYVALRIVHYTSNLIGKKMPLYYENDDFRLYCIYLMALLMIDIFDKDKKNYSNSEADNIFNEFIKNFRLPSSFENAYNILVNIYNNDVPLESAFEPKKFMTREEQKKFDLDLEFEFDIDSYLKKFTGSEQLASDYIKESGEYIREKSKEFVEYSEKNTVKIDDNMEILLINNDMIKNNITSHLFGAGIDLLSYWLSTDDNYNKYVTMSSEYKQIKELANKIYEKRKIHMGINNYSLIFEMNITDIIKFPMFCSFSGGAYNERYGEKYDIELKPTKEMNNGKITIVYTNDKNILIFFDKITIASDVLITLLNDLLKSFLDMATSGVLGFFTKKATELLGTFVGKFVDFNNFYKNIVSYIFNSINNIFISINLEKGTCVFEYRNSGQDIKIEELNIPTQHYFEVEDDVFYEVNESFFKTVSDVGFVPINKLFPWIKNWDELDDNVKRLVCALKYFNMSINKKIKNVLVCPANTPPIELYKQIISDFVIPLTQYLHTTNG